MSKLLQDIPEEKRSGEVMSASVGIQITESRESIERATDTLVKAAYLKRISKLLEVDKQRVLDQMETLRESLCQVHNIRIFVVADVEKLSNPVSAWVGFVEGRASVSFQKSTEPLLCMSLH